MSVTWELPSPGTPAPQVLVVTLVGAYQSDDLERAVTEAAADPRFRAGVSLLFDGRLSEAKITTVTVEQRMAWLSSLGRRGFASRLAIVVADQPHRFGLARMLATRLDESGVQAAVFRDYDEALAWLKGEPPGSD